MRALLALLLCMASAYAQEDPGVFNAEPNYIWGERAWEDIRDAIADMASFQKEIVNYGCEHHPFLTYFYLSLQYSIPMLASAYSKDFLHAMGVGSFMLGSALYFYNMIITSNQEMRTEKIRLLSFAACRGDTHLARRLLNEGIPATSIDGYGIFSRDYTASIASGNQGVLHSALLHGNLETACVLWAHGAHVEKPMPLQDEPFVVTLANNISLEKDNGKLSSEYHKKRLFSCLQWAAYQDSERFSAQEFAQHLGHAACWVFDDIKALVLLRKAGANFEEIVLRHRLKINTLAYIVWEQPEIKRCFAGEQLQMLEAMQTPQLSEAVRAIVLQDRFEKRNLALVLRNREIGKRK